MTVLRQFTKAHQLVGKSDRAIRDMIVLLHSAILEVREYQVQNGVIGNLLRHRLRQGRRGT